MMALKMNVGSPASDVLLIVWVPCVSCHWVAPTARMAAGEGSGRTGESRCQHPCVTAGKGYVGGGALL